MKNPELILHVGTHKTGSTSLQRSFEDNLKLLNSEGIYYPISFVQDTFGRELDSSINREFLSVAKNESIKEIDYLRKQTEGIVNRATSGFYKKKFEKMLISSENLYGFDIASFIYLLTAKQKVNEQDEEILETLKRWESFYLGRFIRLEQLFKNFDIKIVCYLRRQDLLIESLYNQYIKQLALPKLKESKKYLEFISNLYGYPFPVFHNEDYFHNHCIYHFINECYYKTMCAWKEIFGKENIFVIPFEKQQFNRGLEKDFFADILKIDEEKLIGLKEKHFNDRISRDLLEYLIEYAQYPPCYGEYDLEKISNKLNNVDEFQDYFTAEERTQLLNYHEAGNEKIAKEFLYRPDGRLFYEEIKKEWKIYPGLSVEKKTFLDKEFLRFSQRNKTAFKLRQLFIKKREYARRGFAVKGCHTAIKCIIVYLYTIISLFAYIIKRILRGIKGERIWQNPN